jgi:hypothetical protein
MARIRILLILALMIGNAAAERKPFALGLLGGVSGSTYWGKDMGSGDINIFPTGGFSAGVNLPALLGVELDLLYLNKDGSFSSTENGKFRSNNFKLQCLEMPLMIKITAPTGNEVMPIFFGGPAISFLLNPKSTSEYILTDSLGTVQSQPIDTAFVPQQNMEKIDWTLTVGGGVEWGLGTFQLRFDLGQNSLDKLDKVELKTFSMAVMAGFIF